MTDLPPAPVPAAPRRRLPPWINFPNVLLVGLLLWAAPGLLPHLAAVAGVQERAARQPSYSVTTREGRLITPDSLRGKVVLVNVWATWCLPCRVEMPALQSLSQAYSADSFVVLGLSVDRGPASAVDDFLKEYGVTYPVAIVDDRTIAGWLSDELLDRPRWRGAAHGAGADRAAVVAPGDQTRAQRSRWAVKASSIVAAMRVSRACSVRASSIHWMYSRR
jgi:thiol-disulfide isomerase/thioredoxin